MDNVNINHSGKNLYSGQVLIWNKNQWTPIDQSKFNKDEIIAEFEKNPELYNKIIVEMRNRKINKITKK